MITVPSQEIAAFLGNHLDHALHRTGTNFLSSVAADREFRAGCAIMDVLNAVESAQESLRQLLVSKTGTKPSELQTMEVRVMSLYLLHYLYSYLPIHQNPFLCLFVDIYNLAMQDEKLRSERFVTSVILNGKGEELAPKTPSELIELAQKVESRPVNIRMLEDFLPDVPIEDQVQVGLGWESRQQGQEFEDKNSRVIAETIGSRHGDEQGASSAVVLPSSPQANGSKEVSGTETLAPVNGAAAEETEEEELEEWEIEAERRFQDSDVDEAPMPAPVATPAKKSTPATPTSNGKATVSKKNSPVLEATTTATPPPEQEGRRRRKLWARK